MYLAPQILNMKFPKIFVPAFLSFTLVFTACKSDDEDDATIVFNDFSEQAQTDDALINSYLQTHTYNYEDFENQSSINPIIQIDTLAGDNASKTPLSEMVAFTDVPDFARGRKLVKNSITLLPVKEFV